MTERDFSNAEIPDYSIVKAEDELLPLCPMCTKSPLDCDNPYVRETIVPMKKGDDPMEEILMNKKQEDGSWLENIKTGEKFVDGVKYGIYKKEEDIPTPFVCDWFDPKNSG